jgi:hypothetical protein
VEYEGAFYHVTARGNEKRKIFISQSDYVKFLSKLSDALQKCNECRQQIKKRNK